MRGRFLSLGCRMMLKLIFLTEKFYRDYSSCTEIEQKPSRPYIRVGIFVGGVLWAVPLRSHISHTYALWTDKENRCGIDFSKAVVIERPGEYISAAIPHMRPNEFDELKKINAYTVEQKLQHFIKVYKKAKLHPELPRNKSILKYSTLQYFEKYIEKEPANSPKA